MEEGDRKFGEEKWVLKRVFKGDNKWLEFSKKLTKFWVD